MRNLISGLSRPVIRALRGQQRGAVGVLVALLLAGGVLTGMGALVVDVGQIYQNRAELQNGADAGALAVAKSCAQGSCTPSVATGFANDNARNGAEGIDLICGTDGLGGCSSPTGKIIDCPAPPASSTNYVDVHTMTRMPGGSNLLPPVFAKSILGNSNYSGTTVYACAQAVWGAPSSATATAITIADCAWSDATHSGSTYPASVTLDLNGTCGFNGITDQGNCSATISSQSFSAYTGTSDVSPACVSVVATSKANQTPILVPVYDASGGGCGSGQDSSYVLEGFASFVVTSYSLDGNGDGGLQEIDGYFTQDIVPSTGTVGGQDMGAEIIQLTG